MKHNFTSSLEFEANLFFFFETKSNKSGASFLEALFNIRSAEACWNGRKMIAI